MVVIESKRRLRPTNRRPIFLGIALVLALSSLAAAEPPSRLHGDLRNGQTFELAGTVHPRVATATDLGAAPASLPLERITFHIQRSTSQQQQLEKLLQEQQTEGSPQFHRWLTPEQFADRFGASKSDIARLSTWLKQEGFLNVQVSRSRTSVSAAGTAALAQASLQTAIHHFHDSTGTHYANTTDPALPSALQGFVSDISGLNDFHPRSHIATRQRPHFTSAISGDHYLVPGDFATIYDLSSLYSQGIDGTGQKIAVVGETDINLAQVQTFRLNAGLSANNPQVVLDGVDPGVKADEQIEAYLDVEWSGAVAPNATILYVNSSDVFESLRYAIANNLAPVVSVTYGLCESQQTNAATLNALFQQANTQGITVIAASGDTGAADCDAPASSTQTVTTAKLGLAVDFPASSPFVTGVGGTAFAEGLGNYWATTNSSNQASALSYIPETVWNDTVAAGSLSASGGGASILYTKPVWQVGTGVPADGARDVPDLALTASITHDQYLVCGSDGTTTINGKLQIQDCTSGFRDINQNLDAVGGTSADSPSFAGVIALMNQMYGSQGNINPRLYSLAATSTDAFHDITIGDNTVPCTQGTPNCPTSGLMGFTAGTGYDQATGLGSIDGAHLLNEWAPGFEVSASPTGLTLTGANSSATDTITVTALGGFTGTVSFTCSVSAALVNTTCSLPSSLSGSGTASLVVSRGALARVLPPLRWKPPSGVMNGALLMAGLILLAAAALLFGARKLALAPVFTVLGLAMLTACGSGSSSSSTGTTTTAPAPVTATVTVTATSGSTSHTATVSVTED